jgi:cytidylate kinase
MVVTISREYGAAGHAVSRALAPKIGYRLVDDELPRAVATRLGTSPDVVESVENRPPGFGERVLARLSAALPELAQPSEMPVEDMSAGYRREIERLVHEAAHDGDVIIVGRIANAILGARPDVVRVFLYAPKAWRIERVRRSLDSSDSHARSEIERIDEARRAYAQEQYRITLGDVAHYDLLLDTARYGVEGTADIIAAAVRVASENA